MHEDAGQVRAILGRHASLRASTSPAILAVMADPNALVPAAGFAAGLAGQAPADQRRLARDYVLLWARTFRTLVTHLRGRPERALALFADEVYPFLRGDRLAARVQPGLPGRARLTLATGLPDAYLCGLVEGFVLLSGASTTCTVAAPGLFDVHYRVASTDRLARWAQHTASLRLNLVVAALLAAATGIALAIASTAVDPLRAAIVLAGVAAAQLAANALHALRHEPPAGPLAALRPGHNALRGQLALATAVAVAAAASLALTGTPLVLFFAAAGAGVGLLYAPLRDHGLGPILTTLLYGPLIAEGALHAFAIGGHHLDHVLVLPWTLIPGALAAAALYVDDLADAPLDEAGGKRTLAVRLPRHRQALAYGALLAGAALPAAVLLLRVAPHPSPLLLLPALSLAGLALVLAMRVRVGLEDPRRLAPARLGTQLLHAAATAGLVILLAEGAA